MNQQLTDKALSVGAIVFDEMMGDQCEILFTKATLAKFAELILQANKQDTELQPDGFGTEDEHWASSLEELAEQFLNSYEAGEVITVHLSKDLGAKNYKYCFDASGKPFLELDKE